MLKNVYSELEESDWLDASEDIIQTFKDRGRKITPEIDDLLECVVTLPQNIDFKKYNKIMNDIFDCYVKGRSLKLINKN